MTRSTQRVTTARTTEQATKKTNSRTTDSLQYDIASAGSVTTEVLALAIAEATEAVNLLHDIEREILEKGNFRDRRGS